MAHFDYYANTDKDTNTTYPFIVDVQDALLDGLNSRVVIPLTSLFNLEKSYPKNPCPENTIEGKKYSLLTHQMARVSTRTLNNCEGSLAHIRNEIISAIDFLITAI